MTGRLKYTLVVRHPETLVATPLLAGQPVPDWATDLVQQDDLEAEDPTEEPAKEPTNAELEAEIAQRNEGRAEEDRIVPASTRKADLVAALERDDSK